MTEAALNVTFGPAAGDRAHVSKARLATLDAVFRHPLAHNLVWSDVVSLFTTLGRVEQRAHNETAFDIGGAHHLVRKPHGKNLTTEDVMALRHLLAGAGWSPETAHATHFADSTDPAANDAVPDGDLLVAIAHHEARLYHLDIGAADAGDGVIRPYDPHHVLHHLSHKDDSRERGQRAPEDHTFYDRIAASMVAAGRVVVVGHGHGHSNAADHLLAHLKRHHPDIFAKVTSELVADLSALTPPQLLALGRRALTG